MAGNIQANLKGPLPKSYVELGIAVFGGFVDFYKKDVAAVFASVNDPAMQKDLTDADTNAANAMANLTNYLTGLRKTATDNFALGKDLFAQMVKDTEMVDLPIEQIEAAGRADLERNTAALKAECENYLPKGTIAACVAKVAAKKPAEGTLDAARRQLTMLRDFVQKNNVVGIPNDDQALVAEAPPYNRNNAAFIQVPGPYDKGVAATYNIAPPDPKWSKAEQLQYIPSEATLLFTSVHEVWPGHFLQFLHSNSNPDKLEGSVGGVCLRGGLGPLLRGNDVRGGPRARRSGAAHRPDHGCVAARRAVAVRDRPAHRRAGPLRNRRRCSASKLSRIPATRASRPHAAPTIRRISTTRWAS